MTSTTAPPPLSPAAPSPAAVSPERSPREWFVPSFLALLVGAFLLATPLWMTAGGGVWHVTGLSGGLGAALALAGASVVAGVAVGRRWPVAGTVLAVWPSLLAFPLLGLFVWGWWLGLLAVAVVAALDGWRRAVLPYVLTLVVAALYCWSNIPAQMPIGPVTAVSPGGGNPAVGFALYVVGTTAVVAISAATAASASARRRTRAAAAASRRAQEVESVVTERARVARDLHDVVAHHVSLVAVRAESAPYVHPDLDERSREVLADIAQDARGALEELRQVLAVLQRTDGSANDPAFGDPAAERTPQPGASDVVGLVEVARAAGQEVTVLGSFDDLPATPGYVLYRAVQEALTNARRHAPGQPVTISLTTTDDEVELRVTNRLAAPGTPPEPGRGLLGMRERVESLGGTLVVEVPDDAASPRFVVVATLPLAAPSGTPLEPMIGTPRTVAWTEAGGSWEPTPEHFGGAGLGGSGIGGAGGGDA